MKQNRFSIKQQLTKLTISLLVILVMISYLAADLYGRRAARLSYDRLLAGATLQIAENISLINGVVVVDLPRSAFKTLSLAPDDRVFYAITDEDGTLVTGYDDIPMQVENSDLRRDDRSIGPFNYRFYTQKYRGENIRFITMDQVLNDVAIKKRIRVTLGQSLRAREGLASEIRWKALQFVSLFFVVALLVVTLAIRMMLLPLKTLNQELGSRSPVDLTPLDLSVPDEVTPLLKTINHFMNQLNGTLDKLKQFTAIAAHQIRTPLAGLKSQAQNALEEQDSEIRRQQLRRVVECSDLLSETVSQLLMQAELEHRFRREVFEDIQLDALVKEVCREVAVPALQSGVEVSYLGEGEFHLTGDQFALKQMIRNILENAIKYSDDNGLVETNILKLEDGTIVLSVSDNGPGIPEADRPKVFEQFFRGTVSNKPGSGLGLSIAKEIANHHGAELHLLENTPHGLVVEIHFARSENA
ncbi:sensor histidine kinase [Marinobacterium sp. D7]|uniref:sensor histidine kinase n=1 Tax=Marinobacterium ramblicola TaxID=2849041 RepID=UPI001C2D61B5|nr:sensor histidine kinase [Marinobacterium ramblicola]MBV1789489.1 sensor histidine kinase [Marinobacterium ramblicola]